MLTALGVQIYDCGLAEPFLHGEQTGAEFTDKD